MTWGPRTTSRVRSLGSPGCSSSLTASRIGDLAQARVGSVDRLGPCRDGAAGGDVEYVRREAAVSEAQVDRCRPGVVAELDARELGQRNVVRHRLGGGRLEHCFVPQSLLVRPCRRREDIAERVVAFGPLLDRGEDPMLVLTLQRPVLAKPDRLGELAGALDVASAAIDDEVSKLGFDPDDDAVLRAAANPDVLNVRLADELRPGCASR